MYAPTAKWRRARPVGSRQAEDNQEQAKGCQDFGQPQIGRAADVRRDVHRRQREHQVGEDHANDAAGDLGAQCTARDRASGVHQGARRRCSQSG